jgi:hypothetical protein
LQDYSVDESISLRVLNALVPCQKPLKGPSKGAPASITADAVAAALERRAAIAHSRTLEVINKLRSEGLSGREAVDAFEFEFTSREREMLRLAMRDLRVDQEQFLAALAKHADDRAVKTASKELCKDVSMSQQVNLLQLRHRISRAQAMSMLPSEHSDRLKRFDAFAVSSTRA